MIVHVGVVFETMSAMSSLAIGRVIIGRVQFVELFSRNLPADGACDERMRGSMEATAAPPLSFAAFRSGLGASVWERWGGLSSEIMRLSPGRVVRDPCNRKEFRNHLLLLAGCAGIIEPETPTAKNSHHFAKCRTKVVGRQGTLRCGIHQPKG